MEKAVFAWSSGKDSAVALHEALRGGEFEVVSLLTTITEDYDRISMHGVRRELVERQAASIGLPLRKVFIPAGGGNDQYEKRMEEALAEFRREGIETVIFGDIFLEDLREYREDNLAKAGMRAAFPLWKKDTAGLLRDFLDLGFASVVTCVDTGALDARFCGRTIDGKFFSELPDGVDPCGENGEYHSFAFRGPVFKEEIAFTAGETVLRDDRFMFCELLPGKKENL